MDWRLTGEEFPGYDLDRMSQFSVYFLKAVAVPHLVTSSLVKRLFLLPAQLFWSESRQLKPIDKENVSSISIKKYLVLFEGVTSLAFRV